MIRKYKVVEDILERFGIEGIEKMSDSPVGRHLYRGGEVIELEDANAQLIKERGLIEVFKEMPVIEAFPEPIERKTKKGVSDNAND